jgi:hypothetical protein
MGKSRFNIQALVQCSASTSGLIMFTTYDDGVRGDVVVKALRYKPAGRGFDSR